MIFVNRIIDSHVHIFPDKIFDAIWNYFEQNYWNIHLRIYSHEFQNYLIKFNIEKYTSLCYAHKPSISRSLNDFIYHISKNNEMIIPFGSIHPEDPYFEEEIIRILDPKKLNFKGIKLQLMVTNFEISHPKLEILFEYMVKFKKILVVHIGNGPFSQYCKNKNLKMSPFIGIKKIIPILNTFPELKIQIPHLAATEYDLVFSLLSEHKNLYLDTAMVLINHNIFPSGLEYNNMLEKIEYFQNQILFGSDFPNIPYSYEFIINEMKRLNLKKNILEKIMYKNAKRLYDV